MAITKYGTAGSFGFGFFTNKGYGAPPFCSDVRVIAKSKEAQDAEIVIKDNRGNGRIMQDRNATSTVPLHIVFDSGDNCWKEYFTGLPVQVCQKGYYAERYGEVVLDVDNTADKGTHTLAVASIWERKVEDFSTEIAKYSESQIKFMVQQIYALQEAAVLWGKKVDDAIEQAKKERAAKEAGISSVESGVASGFGKYAMGQNSSESKTEDPKVKAPPKKEFTEQEKLQFIREGRCAYCGGSFTGLFKKVCVNCGKAKNYR